MKPLLSALAALFLLAAPALAEDVRATGVVNSVKAADHKVNLSHDPIQAIGWPAMTMDLGVAPDVDLTKVKPGSKVRFALGKGPDGMYRVTAIEPAR